MIGQFKGDAVRVLLQGQNNDELAQYCEIFRNCRNLGNDKYGMEFKLFKAGNAAWHGNGEEQGTTILDSIRENTSSRRSNNRIGR